MCKIYLYLEVMNASFKRQFPYHTVVAYLHTNQTPNNASKQPMYNLAKIKK